MVAGWGRQAGQVHIVLPFSAWFTIFSRELGGFLLPTPQKRNQKGRICGGRKLKGTEAGGGVMTGGNYNGSHSLCQAFSFIPNIVRLVASFLYDSEENGLETLGNLGEVTHF